MALKFPNTSEVYSELQSAVETDEKPVSIDELPHKDWLRQT